MKTIKSIRKLITDECHCYSPILNGIKNYCQNEYDEDCCCRLFKGGRCGYFEKAVLPLNPKLQILYISELKAKKIGYELTDSYKKNIMESESSVMGKIKLICKRCNGLFFADSRRNLYCDQCKRIIRREKAHKK